MEGLELETIEYIINEEKENSGTYAISLVSAPAIQSTFVNLSEHKVEMTLVDEERGVLMGAVLIPNKRILRKGKDGEADFKIFFSADTIRRTSELFLERNHQGDSTLEHQFTIDGNTVVETWIKEDAVHDKSVLHNIDADVGSWIVSMKIKDPTLLKMAKDGVLNGFSIEGLYDDKKTLTNGALSSDELSESEEKEVEDLKQLISKIINK